MKTINVAAAIILDGNNILACQRGYGDFKGGWEFPGGKLEPNESAEQACVREIKEELSIDIRIERFLYTVEYDYDNFHLSMDCFICSIVSGTIADTEHEDMKWLSLNDLWSVDWLPADIRVVKELERRLA